MQVDIRAQGFTLTEGRTHSERRLRSALGAASGRVRRVVMHLSDQNGARGGPDKHCTILASLPGGPPAVIEHQEADLYAAIDGAAASGANRGLDNDY